MSREYVKTLHIIILRMGVKQVQQYRENLLTKLDKFLSTF